MAQHPSSGTQWWGYEAYLVSYAPQDPFFVDTNGSHYPHATSCLFDPITTQVLGDEQVAEDDRDARRCFNCGSPDHMLSSCSKPYDRNLVSLSRQMFNFFADDNGGQSQRIFEVEEWRRQRMEWLEAFEPGQVRGELLRDALALWDGDPGNYVEWLPNIATWGYPKGWTGDENPRWRVWKRLAGEGSTKEHDEDVVFSIHGDDDVPETITLDFSTCDAQQEDPNVFRIPDAALHQSTPQRWAAYPETYFSSSRLRVYDGTDLDALSRLEASSSSNPRPPSSSPPPLPPTSPPAPPPSFLLSDDQVSYIGDLAITTGVCGRTSMTIGNASEEEGDMEFSDSDHE